MVCPDHPHPGTGMQRLIASMAVAAILASACGASRATLPAGIPGTVSPSTTPELASPTATPSASQANGSGNPLATPTPPASHDPANMTPPPQLPHGFSGVILHGGDCFDMDGWRMGNTPDCDLYLDQNLVLAPVNGAVIASKGVEMPPSLFDCREADLVPSPVAPELNSYLCLRTNQGVYGFLVQREDRPTAPAGRIVIDYWLYK
jgi:hypothetical protein